jgi:uncharacterized protein YqiB (DUF1249 family)
VILDSNIVVSWRTRPRGFAALMGLYESNFLRLEQLAGDLSQLAKVRSSEVPGDCLLLLTVQDRARYTSELLLTYLLPPIAEPAGAPERVPDLPLRLYHDARLLEVAGAPDNGAERELDRRWARNMMLNKWLEYCVERGHRFTCPQAG